MSEQRVVVRKGSVQRLDPFSRELERSDQWRQVLFVLERIGQDANETLATWSSTEVEAARAKWCEDVIELCSDYVETNGIKTDFVVTSRVGQTVMRQYRIQIQPLTNNLAPNAEGLTALAMKQQSTMLSTMMVHNQTIVGEYQKTIADLREEIQRMRTQVGQYQRREDEARDRELRLLDRERELIMKEASSALVAAEREEDRLQHIVDRAGDALEHVGTEALKEAVAKLEGPQLLKLLEQYGPMIQKLITEGTN